MTNKCKMCDTEYNQILPDGYCDGCRKCLEAQQRKIAEQFTGSGGTSNIQQYKYPEVKIYN